jgi:hypothetical protein
MKNDYPFYFRDSVFSIAYENYTKNSGEKSITKCIASVLWNIKHLGNYGFSARYAIDRMQGMLKTNRSVSRFHSDHIDDMINANEQKIVHSENYGVSQSDYVESIGESLDVGSEPVRKTAVKLDLEQQIYSAVYDFVTGLNVLVLSNLRRKIDAGIIKLVENCAKIKTEREYFRNLFVAFKKSDYFKELEKNGAKIKLDKKQFLVYVYACFYPKNTFFNASINLKGGIIEEGETSRDLITRRVERIKRTQKTTDETVSKANNPEIEKLKNELARLLSKKQGKIRKAQLKKDYADYLDFINND